MIILDLGLPDIQGLELLRTIRERNDKVPIVVLSSRGDEHAKVEALDLGADDYVTKPFGMEELLAACAPRSATSCRFMASGRSSASATCRSTSSGAWSRSAIKK